MIAWSFVFLGAVFWSAAVWFYLRRPQWLRWWLALLVPVWALSPVPVEGYPNDSAPAMIAAFYELFITPDGNPGTAIAVLVMGTLLLSIGVALVNLALRFLALRGFDWDHLVQVFRRK